jgi:hypothetical protein
MKLRIRQSAEGHAATAPAVVGRHANSIVQRLYCGRVSDALTEDYSIAAGFCHVLRREAARAIFRYFDRA